VGRDSSGGIATRYGLDGPGIESRWGWAWIFVCCECRVLSGRGLYDELITRPEESYRLCCVVVCDLETSRVGAPYIYRYDISNLRVNDLTFKNPASYIYRTGLPLPSKCCILYILFSTNISTEYFKHAAHSLFFSSKCRLFHNVNFFGSCIIHILRTGCAKI
jgi:hypothetical protein